jgi:hypothetical protein
MQNKTPDVKAGRQSVRKAPDPISAAQGNEI